MNKTKKSKVFLCFFACFAVIFNSTALAAVPKGTVVIGDKAYDLKYANDLKNLKEIYEAVKNKNGEIYVKSSTGIWFDNETSKATAEEFVPKVTYKDDLGNTKEFAEEDGDEIKLEVLAVGIIDSNTLKITFSKELDKESALNKENYIINGEALGENDLLEVTDENTIVLNLKENISETSSFGLEVKKDIKDKNKNPLKSEYKASQSLFSEKSEFSGDLSLIDSKVKLTSKKIKGNVYLAAENAFISDVEIDGTLVIDTKEKKLNRLRNIKADRIIILSENKDTLKFNNVKANELISLSKNTVEIELENSSEINKALIKSSAVIKGEKDSFKEIILDTEKADTKVELKGTMNPSVRVRNSVNVFSDLGNWDKPLVIKPNTNKAVVELKGKYSKVEILKESKVNVLQGSVISDSILVNSSAELKVDKDSEVENVVVNTRKKNNNVTIKGKVSNLTIDSKAEVELSEVEIEKLVINTDGAKISSDNKSKVETLVTNNNEYALNGDNKLNIGKTVTTDTKTETENKDTGGNNQVDIDNGVVNVSVKGIELEKKEIEILIGDTLQLKANVRPSNASNKKVRWSSSDENIVTIDNSGNIRAVGVGQATITAMTHNKKYKAECKVTVKPIKATGIELSSSEVFLKLNESVELDAIVRPENATNKNITWTVANKDVASVKNGVVTAKAVGETKVTASTVDGNYTASCRVIVSGLKYEYKTVGNKITFILDDESIENNTVSIELFDVNNKNLEFYGDKKAENGKCQISTVLEKGKTYNGTISITGVGKIVVYNFTID